MNFIDIWNSYVYPLIAILIPVIATIHTLNMRLKNENREKHQPYLIIDSVSNIYYYTLNVEDNIRKSNELKLELILKNIGYGVSTNVKFYDISDAKQISGCQELNDNINQKLFTTFDIASKDSKKMKMAVKYNTNHINNIKFLCIYQDLNFNIYNFIIGLNIKKRNKFDYYSYEPSSLSYKRCYKENKSRIESIIRDYKNL